MELTEGQKELNGEIAEYFKDMPWDRIDQTNGRYMESCGSCVAAHLFNFFGLNNLHPDPESDYVLGAKHWEELMGLGDTFKNIWVANPCKILKTAGLNLVSPWGTDPWNLHPHEVFKRLSE